MMDADFTYDLSLSSGSYYSTLGVHPTRARDPFKAIRDKDSGEIIDD